MSTAIVVPVKSPHRAKHRLMPLLTEVERFRLASATARDVFRAVQPLAEYARLVISEDRDVLNEADNYGLEPVLDRIGQGQSAAVQQGFLLARERSFSRVFTIPGDVPAVTTAELRELAGYRPEIEVLLVSDRERIGTNGLRLVPPDAIRLRFGEDSFRLHRDEAEHDNRSFAVLDLPGLQIDLDRPDDVAAFLQLGRQTETLALLEELKVADRLLATTTPRG